MRIYNTAEYVIELSSKKNKKDNDFALLLTPFNREIHLIITRKLLCNSVFCVFFYVHIQIKKTIKIYV